MISCPLAKFKSMLSTLNSNLPDLILNKLCCDYPLDYTKFLLHGGLQDPKSAGQNPKGFLHNHSPMAQSAVEYPLTDVQASLRERFLQLGVITNEEVHSFGSVGQQ